MIIYNMMILPILKYSSTTEYSHLAKLASLECRASKVIGIKSTPNTSELIQSQICSIVEKCLQGKIEHESFDNYFVSVCHRKETRNNISLRLPRIKLGVPKQIFYFDRAKLFNMQPESTRKLVLLY